MGAPAHVIAEWARHCHCCPVCSVKPCDGVMAGGICDSLECVCDGAIDFDGEGPSDASPLTDDLDDATIHEPMTEAVSLRRPSALAVIALVAMDAGVPMCVAQGWLSSLNFQDETL